jgi:hypothetical protein
VLMLSLFDLQGTMAASVATAEVKDLMMSSYYVPVPVQSCRDGR